MQDLHSQLLGRARECLGGEVQLQQFLGVSSPLLRKWSTGRARIPDHLLLRVVDLLDAPRSPPEFGNVHGLGDSPFWRADFLREADVQPVFVAALKAVMDITHAPLGNIQINRADGLHIKVQHGFSLAFLRFFSVVDDDDSACGVAMAQQGRVVVEDVRSNPIFAGKASQAVMLEAGALSVQSTPVTSRDGELLAVLSTHDHVPRDIANGCAEAIDRVAQRLAEWLNWKSAVAG